ncbi:MAG TPA: hypothetical protein VGV61_15005, partial [Thermoanaerobaculia bacterium]|nr:hypothetical protein [Thermoanaerobaculia bacterium]
TYSALEWLPQHVALTEIRLWREGTKIHGLGLCSVVLPASDTMLFPQRFDTRVRSGGSFDLPLARCGGTLRPVSGGLELTGRDPRDWRWRRTVLLEHATRVADPALDLVPGTDLAAWRQWMRSVVPPVVQWKAPPRPAAAAEPAAPAANR